MNEIDVLERYTIPWKRLQIEYNKKHGTKYDTVKKWLEALYQKSGNNTNKMAELLPMSQASISKIMVVLGAKKAEPLNKRFYAIPEGRMAKMTLLEIMKETGISDSYLYGLFEKTGRAYKRR